MKALETHWRGYRFRSRTEARWAVFFDAYGLRWEYEPEAVNVGGVNYLPDFRVYIPNWCSTVWLEVKSSDGCNYKELEGARRLGARVVFGPPEPFAVWHNVDGCGFFDTDFCGKEYGGLSCFTFNDRRRNITWAMGDGLYEWLLDHDETDRWNLCGEQAKQAIKAARGARFGAYE